jgi:hypothetical protein
MGTAQKLVRPFHLNLCDAQGVLIERWVLNTPAEDPNAAWLTDKGELTHGGQIVLCAELANVLRRASKNT